MKAYIKERTIQTANYIVETKQTIRQTAEVFNLSKSTVHNDLSKRLEKIDMNLMKKVQEILDKNFSEKHIRGGLSTKLKYQNFDSKEKC